MSSKVRDYEKLAGDIIAAVGGKDNISEAAHCATRLRLVLKETPAGAKEKVSAMAGVITVVESGGQASYEIEQGRVTMDGVLLTEKRKKVRPGSTVVLDNRFAIYVSRKE